MDSDDDTISKQLRLKITHQLYLHSPIAIFSSILNVLIVILVIHDITQPVVLYSWAGITTSYLMLRLIFCRHVIKKGITLSNLDTRLRQFALSICISGIVMGAPGILFLSLEYPAYNSFIFFLMGGMFAGSAGAFAINQRVFYLFSTPVILPVTIHSFMLGGAINTAMSVMGIVFVVMMVAVMRRMNVTIVEAFTVSIENKILAERTKHLNEKLKVSNENLKALSFKDTMTNIGNRRYLTEILTPEIDRFASSLQRSLGNNQDHLIYGVYIIDIDHFKNVNDTWGHKCGDEVIIQFVKVIQSLIRKEDVICRWGGEEFVIILKRTTLEYIHIFAQKVIHAVNSANFQINDSLIINKTCSLGYSKFPFFDHLPLALSLDQTIEVADQALYHAKESGRDRAVLAEYDIENGEINNLEDTRLMMEDITKSSKHDGILLTPC